MILLKFIQCLGLPWRKEKGEREEWQVFRQAYIFSQIQSSQMYTCSHYVSIVITNQVNYEDLKPWEPLLTDTSICKLFVIYRARDEVRLFSLLGVPILILPCASVPILATFGNPSNAGNSQNGEQINSDPNDRAVSESPKEKKRGGLASWIS